MSCSLSLGILALILRTIVAKLRTPGNPGLGESQTSKLNDLEKASQFGQQFLRFFFRNEMPALERAAVDVGGDFAPVGEAVEQGFDDALAAPEGEDGHFYFPAEVLLVVHQVDGRGGAVVLAGGVDGARVLEGAL